MRELIHQQNGEYIFWKNEEEYGLIFFKNKTRRKEMEYKLSKADKENYYENGLDFIRKLVQTKI